MAVAWAEAQWGPAPGVRPAEGLRERDAINVLSPARVRDDHRRFAAIGLGLLAVRVHFQIGAAIVPFPG